MLRGARKVVLARALALTLRQANGPAVEDAVSASMIPSVRESGLADRVLAEVDQEGFLFARDALDIPFFNRRITKIPRHKAQVDVVLRGGAVLIRKQHLIPPACSTRDRVQRRLGGTFYTEVAALARLQGFPFVPQLRGFVVPSRTIFMDFIRGENLKQRLALKAHPVFTGDINANPTLAHLSDAERVRREFALWAAVPESKAMRVALEDALEVMHARGVALQDVNLGNVIVGARTGLSYWIDFEDAHLRGAWGWSTVLRESRTRFHNAFGSDHLDRWSAG